MVTHWLVPEVLEMQSPVAVTLEEVAPVLLCMVTQVVAANVSHKTVEKVVVALVR